MQTPSPGPLIDHAVSVSPMNNGASFANASPAGVSNGPAGFGFSGSPMDAQHHVSQGQFVIEALQHGQTFGVDTNAAAFLEHGSMGFDFGLNNFGMLPDAGYGLEDAQAQSIVHLDIPSSMQTGVNASPPWTHVPMQQDYNAHMARASFDSHSGSSIGHFTPNSGSSSIELSPKASPGSLQFRNEGGSRSATSKAIPIPTTDRKDRVTSKVRKTQRRNKSLSSTSPLLSTSAASRLAGAAAAAAAAQGGTPLSAGAENPVFLFCNATPDTWAKGGGSFDGTPDASKASQKGRKGALSTDTRANALAVRQKGACFCCHVRKVKCDQQRPCRSCERFCAQVPQAVCWQFDDFTRALFPAFVRGHFARDEMARFVAENVASFTLNGVEHPDVTVMLSSGPGLRSKLSVRAKFFTPRAHNSDVMEHWFHTVGGSGADGGVELEAYRSAPLGLDAEGAGPSFRAELKRKVEKYVDDMVQEPMWPAQLAAEMEKKSSLPRLVLQAAQRYAQQSGSGIVRRALGVYTMHYLLAHHLTMTPQCVENLRHVNPVTASGPWMTPRLLNRQIKAVVDGLIAEGVAALFDEFGKLLKRRARNQWAPCTAALVVFCMLMESIQASADVYAISEIEIEMRKNKPAVFRRAEALEANKAIENMPFKQLAFQFHQIYQSHSRDASARSFNPLVDDIHAQSGDLDSAALEFVMTLRSMVHLEYRELDWLTPAPLATAGESHPYPRNVEEDYIGRLMAKFLLSFLDGRYITGE